MKSFFHLMRKYLTRYKRYIAGTFLFNILAAIFNVFSFTVLLPILQILFKVNDQRYQFIEWGSGDFIETAKNNGYYYSQQLIDTYGPATTLRTHPLQDGGVFRRFRLPHAPSYRRGPRHPR